MDVYCCECNTLYELKPWHIEFEGTILCDKCFRIIYKRDDK